MRQAVSRTAALVALYRAIESCRPATARLFEDLEDVNYHSFLARLIELVEQRAPKLAAQLDGWCSGGQGHAM